MNQQEKEFYATIMIAAFGGLLVLTIVLAIISQL